MFSVRTLAQLEDDVPPCEAQMENWKTNLAVMASKERQYLQQYSNYKVFVLCYYYQDKIYLDVIMKVKTAICYP